MPINPIIKIERIIKKAYGPQHWWPAETRFEVCVGAILTQNTSWSNVESAITALKKADCLTVRKIIDIDKTRLATLIRSSGYFNQKAKRLKALAEYLLSRGGYQMRLLKNISTPVLRQELLAINGIGPETADSILLYAFAREVFVIDAYTRRIMTRHKLAAENESYESLRLRFEAAIKGGKRVERFNELHARIVRLAKNHCKTKPNCAECPLEGIFGK